ncbi:hypothetical protein N7462_008979 [Penicillium macrosclerotiorum]|uniref:uncharacterized protein n=1 Tax=Penicillium macrosclerotiorum TaxID=303699 RepID=UPI002548A40C|nr:uncharacterized protein N7462_008979 [Penicillium macrosclerotiorum]KAJ5676082.1 hypothetical protein N7462_008979 [Penicillium macrosclerotiorum]
MSSPNPSKSKNDENLKLLVSCIVNSEHRKLLKVDWDVVAKDVDVPTSGAARKRYERVMNSFGYTVCGSSKSSPKPGTPSKRGTVDKVDEPEQTTPKPTKKRKHRSLLTGARDAEPEKEQETE